MSLELLDFNLQNTSMLYKPSKEVRKGEKVTRLVERMFTIMNHEGYTGGIGLAANQIGLDMRIIVVDVPSTQFRQEFINPVITKSRGPIIRSQEGCLSYPKRMIVMMRFSEIIVHGYDRDWKPIRRRLKGINAVVVQHEVDHLDGFTITHPRKIGK